MTFRFPFCARESFAVVCVVAISGCAMLQLKPAPERAQELDRKALEAYKAGDLPGAKDLLEKAIAVGEEAGLADRAMARRHLTLGVVYLGLGDRDRGLGQFGLALHLQPSIEVPPELNRPGARKSLATARAQLKRRRGPAATAAGPKQTRRRAPAATAVAEAKRDEKTKAASRPAPDVRVESVRVTANT